MARRKSPRARATPAPADRRVIAFILPVDLIRKIKSEANDRDLWPARIVEEMARERYAAKSRIASA